MEVGGCDEDGEVGVVDLEECAEVVEVVCVGL